MSNWNDVLRDWQARVTDFQTRQQLKGVALEKWHYYLGIPATILAAVAGTTVFANLSKSFSYNARVTVVVISVATAILTALQTFMNFGKRSEQHRDVSTRLGDVRRSFDIELQFPPETVAEKRAALEKLNKEIGAVTKDAPLVHVPIFEQKPESGPESRTIKTHEENSGDRRESGSARFDGNTLSTPRSGPLIGSMLPTVRDPNKFK
jgi:hypothetical protein